MRDEVGKEEEISTIDGSKRPVHKPPGANWKLWNPTDKNEMMVMDLKTR